MALTTTLSRTDKVKERVELNLYSPSGFSWPLPLPPKSHYTSSLVLYNGQFLRLLSESKHVYRNPKRMNAIVQCRTTFIFVFSTKVFRWGEGRVCEFMNSETSILDSRELPALRADGLLCWNIREAL